MRQRADGENLVVVTRIMQTIRDASGASRPAGQLLQRSGPLRINFYLYNCSDDVPEEAQKRGPGGIFEAFAGAVAARDPR